MSNPLFRPQPPTGDIQQLIQQFQQFRQMFQGDPRQQLQQLLNSGRVSQEAYNNAYQTARQLQQIIDGK